MADNEVSLLYKLRADASQTATATAAARASITTLRAAFSSEVGQMAVAGQKSFKALEDSVRGFARSTPVVGNSLGGILNHISKLGSESSKSGPNIKKVADGIADIAAKSGRSVGDITNFLTKFVQIEGQAKRDSAAIDFLGASMAQKLLPALEKTGGELATVASQSAATGSSLAAVAGPVGIAAVAVLALAAAYIFVAKQIFDVTQSAAQLQGQLFDLSQQTGISVETLSTLEVVARTTGGSLGNLTASLNIFQRQLEATEDPTSKASANMRELGVDSQDTEVALRQAFKGLNDLTPGFHQTALAMELFGRGGKNVLAILKETNGDLDATTDRLRKLGLIISTEDAKAADEFNDQLAVLQFQIRAITIEIGSRSIPIILEALKQFSQVLVDNREAIKVVGQAVAVLSAVLVNEFSRALQLTAALISTQIAPLKALQALLEAIAFVYERIANAIRYINNQPPISHPSAGPGVAESATETPTQATEATPVNVRSRLAAQLQAQKELQGAHQAFFEEERRAAAARIAQSQRDFEAGRKNAQDNLTTVIANNKLKIQAEIDALETTRSLKLTEAAIFQNDVQKRTELGNQMAEIDQQIADKRSSILEFEKEERHKFEQAREAEALAHEERKLALAEKFDAINIARLTSQVKAGIKPALDADTEIAHIELTALDRQQSSLVKRIALITADTAKRRALVDELKSVDAERTALEQEQSDRRLTIIQKESDIALQLLKVKEGALLATIQSLGELRVLSVEETERRILKVRLDALDQEIALVVAKGGDPRLLVAQRAALEAEGFRNVQRGRDEDLKRLREYENEKLAIERESDERRRTIDRINIDILAIEGASRLQLIRLRRDAELAELEDEKRIADQRLRAEEKAALERVKGLADELEKKQELERLFNERRLLNEEEFQRRKKEIIAGASKDEEGADPFGRLKVSIRDVANEIENSIVPMGEILSGTFSQISNAIGQTVKNWVLLGETGPAVMRKMLAEALASIAAEAAMNAVKELALGFAMLFLNPADSAAHFAAAGLWASIAGGSALAGRAVAGDLFKPKQGATGGAGTSTGGTGTGAGTGGPTIINADRNNISLVVTLRHEPGGAFDAEVVKSVVKGVQANGPLRDVIVEERR